MRICLVSNYAGSIDEGMMNVSFHLGDGLSRNHDVLVMHARKILVSNHFWQKLKEFNPQIVHIILRPSITTLMLAKLLKRYCSEAKILLSAMQPPNSMFFTRFASLMKPDLVLIQSEENQQLFTRLGCKTSFLPSGVDTSKFLPVSAKIKAELRRKYSVDSEKFVALHVGHILKGRNIETLNKLQEDDNQVIVVGSTIFKPDNQVCGSLIEHGCLVWRKYFTNIEKVYSLSDCYVFPTINKSNSIEIPLSVMEAMSCNLPVISTKFGMLTKIFTEGEGLKFVDTCESLSSELASLKEKIRNGSIKVETRKKVLPYSWSSVVAVLEDTYQNVTENA